MGGAPYNVLLAPSFSMRVQTGTEQNEIFLELFMNGIGHKEKYLAISKGHKPFS